MGIRMTQYIGLHPKAKTWIEENVPKVPLKFCPHCSKPLKYGVNRIGCGKALGMFDEEIVLYSYLDSEGKSIAREYEQCAPWSSGPMIFVGLEVPDGRIEWSESEIEEML